MLVKAQLVSEIGENSPQAQMEPAEAAKVLGLTQPKLSKMLRGQFRGISEMKDDGLPGPFGLTGPPARPRPLPHCTSTVMFIINLV